MGIVIRLHCKIWQKNFSKLLEETKNGIFRDLEHYKGKTFEDVVASVPPGVDPSDWRTMCEKWNTMEEQDIVERNKQNRTHQNMTYRWGCTSIYQLKDDFVKTHQREPDRMEVFRMGRCKDLPTLAMG
ncbi:hypothetical protein Taro_027137 [Colocasia esculenta]|uniref:Uncharacterized protein n=1 Tax=Colocasia esculenta TaxID=4460 RepID=A0A843VLM2_COLES|nr:hypothetical protein [Colocasia esculenta]